MLVAVCKDYARLLFFFQETMKLFVCEQKTQHSLQRQIMQTNAHGFGLMIACLTVGYLMEFQTESYEQRGEMLVLKQISRDVLYTLSNAWFIFMLLIWCTVDTAPNPFFVTDRS